MNFFIFILLLLTAIFSNEVINTPNELHIEFQEHHDHLILKQLIITFTVLLLGIILWISALKKHNKQLQKIKTQLYELNQTLEERVKIEVEKNKEHQLIMLDQSRLAQMGQTINMIAHQWRQPLNNLALINQVLVLRYNKYGLDDKAINEFKNDSTTQIETMSNTINDFRDFFKPDKDKVEFDPKTVIKHSLRLMNPTFKSKNIEILTDYKESAKLIAYPHGLGQSMVNILNNAKDALIKNNLDKERYIHLTLYKQENKLIITIADNAGGIEPKIINHIFDPYFSTKMTNTNTGLGLYMSKMIIEEHMHGLLTVSNTKDGSIFTIALPLK